MKRASFKMTQYNRVEALMKETDTFYGDPGNGTFRGKTYPFVLQDAMYNLFAPSKSDICDYFAKNNVAWWNGQLTNHTLSSQVACLNHLFPIREDKNAVLSLVQQICPGIQDVLPVAGDRYLPAYIQFEAVSEVDHLNEMNSTRGSNCTSVDALICGVHKDGRRILFPIEWKYVEAYGNENKADGSRGATRKARYTDLINQSTQLKIKSHDVYYFEPFYQLMRQTLWSEQMIHHKNSERVKADDYRHIHVIPIENSQLLHKTYHCSGKNMEDTWRMCILEQSKYIIVSPQDLVSPVLGGNYTDLFEYLDKRYW